MAELLLGYGLIGTWPGQGETLGNALRQAGLNYTEIELVGGLFPNEHLRTAAVEGPVLSAFVTEMRAREIVTAIVIANWNGADTQAQDDSWMQAWIDWIIDLGPELLVVEGVSEPDNGDEKAVRWQQMVQDQLGGTFTVMANGPGGRDDPIVDGWALRDWHWCDDWTAETVLLPPTVNNTDCGPMLDLTPSHAADLLGAAIAAGAYALIYDLTHAEPDTEVIAALGGVLPPEGLTIPAFIGTGSGATSGFVPQVI